MQKALRTYKMHCWGKKKNQELNNVFTKIKFSSYEGREKEKMAYTLILLVLRNTVKAGTSWLRFLGVSEDNSGHAFTGKFNLYRNFSVPDEDLSLTSS